ncbi:MAG: ferric reductase-like transmembrane domain-containing protein [Candidatus Zambryskibacteria bacterium]|nr:ferric reductase-like transmembrane domain-containing protein [Candidatus Zambryskibacteria bacterium]
MIKVLKNSLSVIFIVILAIIPLIIWFFMSPLALRFSSSSTSFRSLGQLTGLSGMALLSINFILAARFRFLDKLFNGLNVVYIKHHLIGAIAFCLLLFHPTFLIIQYLYISLKSSFLFIFSMQNWAINLGELSLLVFIVLMVFTFYFNFKYQNWKNTHKYLGIVLLLGGLHMLLIPSDISNNVTLKYYMLGLAIIGAYSYFYRTILGVYKKGEYKYKLEKIIKVNDNVVELKLSPLARKIKFLPGQFVFLRFDNNGILSESHPFSITSCTDDDNLSLGIKTLGDYTSMVYLLKPGAICLIEGPFGAFSYTKSNSKRQIWIAGGIGITPFLSMARQINSGKVDKNYKIDLYYSVKNSNEAVFSDELAEISKQNDNFKFYQHFSEKDGRISANSVVKNNSDIHNVEIFLCGPSEFMRSLRSQFVKLGFDNSKIYSEEFSL